MTSVVLVGGGRMGALIREALEADDGFEVLGCYDVSNSGDLDELAPRSDLAIDFSNRAALPHVEAYVRRTHSALVSGTTGFDESELARMRALLGPDFAEPRRVQIHYLGQRVEVEIILPSAPAAEALEALRSRRKDWLAEHPHYRNIRVFVEIAP